MLSDISSTPEWEKWQMTLHEFNLAMVISLTHISRNAAKVEKMPTLPFSLKPKPAAAEKFPLERI